MTEILKGKPVADAITEELKERCEKLKEKGITPALAIIRVGEREDDLSYERGAGKRAELVGAKVLNVVFPEDVSKETLFAKIKELNEDNNVHGILLFRPLPKHIDADAARKLIAPSKDVDGCTDASLAGVFTGTKLGFAPCTAESAVAILKHYNIPISGSRAVVIGRSLVIGRPVALLLMHENATVTVCHTRTKDVPAVAKDADILIAASGVMESIGCEYTNKEQTIIDVGISFNEEKGKLCGDVKYDEVFENVKAITPVPGGVGSVTTAILFKHVIESAEKNA